MQEAKLIHRNLSHFYILTIKEKKEKLKNNPFTIALKAKYLGITLPKETKDLYSKICKTLTKEIEDDTNRWRYTMFLDWKNQCCQNDHTTQGSL